MAKRHRAPLGLLALIVMLMTMLALTTPASAHHKEGHDKGNSSSKSGDHDGDADSDSSTNKNESNDGDARDATDPNADEGDNAHPSGKDRSRESGGSGNQGKSESDPDGNENGGPDKPGGSGGVDKDDQDGNNGCGNDDDFEDDNNGNCGGKKKERSSVKVKGKGIDKGDRKGKDKTSKDRDVVLGDDVSKPPAEAPIVPEALPDVLSLAASAGPAADVLGARVRRADRVAPAAVRGVRVRGRALPFTGSDLGIFILIALGLVVSGVMLRKVRA